MTARDRSPVNRLVGAFVNPVVESIDRDDVLGNVDLNELIQRDDSIRRWTGWTSIGCSAASISTPCSSGSTSTRR